MQGQSWGRGVLGAIIGLVIGVLIGKHRAAELAAERGEIVPTGWNPIAYFHYPRFWVAVIFSTLAIAFIAGRFGRASSESDM